MRREKIFYLWNRESAEMEKAGGEDGAGESGCGRGRAHPDGRQAEERADAQKADRERRREIPEGLRLQHDASRSGRQHGQEDGLRLPG